VPHRETFSSPSRDPSGRDAEVSTWHNQVGSTAAAANAHTSTRVHRHQHQHKALAQHNQVSQHVGEQQPHLQPSVGNRFDHEQLYHNNRRGRTGREGMDNSTDLSQNLERDRCAVCVNVQHLSAQFQQLNNNNHPHHIVQNRLPLKVWAMVHMCQSPNRNLGGGGGVAAPPHLYFGIFAGAPAPPPLWHEGRSTFSQARV
jgi:hypothetical protein